jgi:ubiquinone/menaquinone biosynthesis C-methylase UbiE
MNELDEKDSSSSNAYSGKLKERAINSDSLKSRLEINRKYQSKDFHGWLHKKLNVQIGENILDVGCGTGAQSLRFLEDIGLHGTISALDISESSIANLLENVNGDTRIEAITEDMANLNDAIQNMFKQKTFTLAHSSYALYYSLSCLKILRCMADSITSYGRVAVFTPGKPHGMVEIAEKYSKVPTQVIESLDFGPKILEPEFRKLFWEVDVHYFQSEMKVTSTQEFMEFYKATTYYDSDAEIGIENYAKNEIQQYGLIRYPKNGYLIIGRERK